MKIAVIGSGISGLSSALILSQNHEVHLFESEDRLGGHAHTSKVKIGHDDVAIDTGFLVYNELTYPNLIAMFEYLNVDVAKSDMSLSISIPAMGLEWAGDNLNTIFAQRKNFFSFKFYKLLIDILKFHKRAEQYRNLAAKNNWSLQELLDNQGYSKELKNWYILPMVAAIWSTPEKSMLEFPAETFLTFFLNHKLLQVNERPQWYTVRNGSINYVNKIAEKLKHIHLDECVRSVEKTVDNSWNLITNKENYKFDAIVFATQPFITKEILKQAEPSISKLLNCFSAVKNTAVLHQDDSIMPKSKKCWSSWSVRSNLNTKNEAAVSLTYYLNRLQPLNTKENVFVTLNPSDEPKNILKKMVYYHPMFDQVAIDAQKQLHKIQGIDNLFFAGAWTKYGFHEDGIRSAVNVCKLLGVEAPWKK